DRIVPGAPPTEDKEKIESELGIRDDLMIIAEVYRLWAIESGSEKVKNILSFAKTDTGVMIAPDITKFRELKLRLLNGTHTLSCALAILAGFETVKESMDDADIVGFMEGLTKQNIIPVLIDDSISEGEATVFAASVLDRFRNPSIKHKWISISMQYASKMKLRNLPVLEAYYKRFGKVPTWFALGFAAFILFMKVKSNEEGKFLGEANGATYQVTDDKAAVFAEHWKKESNDSVIMSILKDQTLWDQDLTQITGLAEQIDFFLESILNHGSKATIKLLQADKITANS
ncbi:MAG: altronate oxidoreductase, partial [Chitinophagaceae bacterium]